MCILTKNEDIVLAFTQGFVFRIPRSAKGNVMTIDFVVYLGTCNRIKPTSVYCASPTTAAQSHVRVERKYNGQL